MSLDLHHPYKVELEMFEGPLDLLLHLIKKHDVDIMDINISRILDQYMEYLDLLEEMNIDLVGDFLLMASELAYLKSKTLLPDDGVEEEDEGDDPRADLIRRLLEYQRYKDAAQELRERPMLGRDVFEHGIPYQEPEEEGPLEMDLFQLISCFNELLQKAPKKTFHEVHVDRVSVTDRIYEVMDMLKDKSTVEFSSLFEAGATRDRLIVTFLAILEMARLKMLKVTQTERMGEVYIAPSFEAAETGDLSGKVTLQ